MKSIWCIIKSHWIVCRYFISYSSPPPAIHDRFSIWYIQSTDHWGLKSVWVPLLSLVFGRRTWVFKFMLMIWWCNSKQNSNERNCEKVGSRILCNFFLFPSFNRTAEHSRDSSEEPMEQDDAKWNCWHKVMHLSLRIGLSYHITGISAGFESVVGRNWFSSFAVPIC